MFSRGRLFARRISAVKPPNCTAACNDTRLWMATDPKPPGKGDTMETRFKKGLSGAIEQRRTMPI